MNDTELSFPEKTIATCPRDSSFWSFDLLVNDTMVECQGSHPYDGAATIWQCTHEAFTKGTRNSDVIERFSQQAIEDVLAEIRSRTSK